MRISELGTKDRMLRALAPGKYLLKTWNSMRSSELNALHMVNILSISGKWFSGSSVPPYYHCC
jgi:hypothetical protein